LKEAIEGPPLIAFSNISKHQLFSGVTHIIEGDHVSKCAECQQKRFVPFRLPEIEKKTALGK
jgi:hypothetical protein